MRNKRLTTALELFAAMSILVGGLRLDCSAQAVHSKAGATVPATLDLKRVVARVNGAVIREADLQDEMEQLYPSNGAHGAMRADRMGQIRKQAIDELVVKELAYQRAVKQGQVVPMEKVRAEYRRIRAKSDARIFDAALQASNLSVAQYLKRLQRQMTVSEWFQAKAVRPARYTDEQLRAYYNQNKEKFRRPEQVKARLFLAAVEEGANPAEDKKARDKAEMVLREAHAGKDFAVLCEQHSEDVYRVRGGDLGWVHKGRLEPEFEKVAFSLQPGQVSEVFRTAYGYNIIKLEGREQGRLMEFKTVKLVLRNQLQEKKFTQLREALVASLKKGARIEVVEETATAGVPPAGAAGTIPMVTSH